jgi:cytochrome c-type biogenesis protein
VADVSLFAAFVAGVLSFISPCVLPLVPGYISFISGVSFEDMQQAATASSSERAAKARKSRTRRQMLVTSLAFVAGFSLVFIAFGASATALGKTLVRQRALLEKVAGALVVIFGLHLSGLFRIKWLDRDTRIQTSHRPAGPFGALLVGVAFAFGWTPCIGPILGGILTVAGSRNTVGEGVLLLAVYSAGLGVPFLLTALAVDRFFVTSARIRRHYRAIEMVAGIMLIGLGILIFTDRFTMLSRYLDRLFPWLTRLS